MALWSINEQLAGRGGAALEHPETYWQSEALMAAVAEGEAMEEATRRPDDDEIL